MPRDIGKYHTQITQFVDELCRVYYKHSQPEDRRDINSEIAKAPLRDMCLAVLMTKILGVCRYHPIPLPRRRFKSS